MKVIKQSGKTLAQMSPRLKKYAELLATGLYHKTQCAVKAGYPVTTAEAKSYRWIADTRDDSFYPALYDYYHKLYQKNLRRFDANIDSITRELSLIAFSDITKYVDLPSESNEEKSILARKVQTAFHIVEAWKSYEKAKKFYDTKQDKRKREPEPPDLPTDAQIRLLNWFQDELDERQQNNLMFWVNYVRGSVRIKNREEIPEDLLPAIAEVHETRDGIRVKLYDKLGALDKLAKIRKLYDIEDKDNDNIAKIEHVSIYVNGTRSNLLSEDNTQAQGDQKPQTGK